MLPIGAVLVDFDGTACRHDVAEHLLERFGHPSWVELDRAWERGEIGAREVLDRQAAMLRGPVHELLDYALSHCPIDPTFAPFVRRLERAGLPVVVVSDGFGFYVEPILAAAGLEDVSVITNGWDPGDPPGLRFGEGGCPFCGTCKVRVVHRTRAARGQVAFVGEGPSDRFGARSADVVFAKDALQGICEEEGIPYLKYGDFDDVWSLLGSLDAVPGPAGVGCPGWPGP
jgi:2,3-diketo-5-methylthio-1-phosphopentane phosphatase